MGDKMEKYDIFLIYARKNLDFAQFIARYLSELGLKVWFDQWSQVPGSNYFDISKEIFETTKIVAILIGEDQPDTFYQREIDNALTYSKRFKIIPILIPGSNFDNIPTQMKEITCVDLRQGYSAITNLDSIIKIFQATDNIPINDNQENFSGLIECLKNPEYFVKTWNKDEFEIKKYWAKIESQSNTKMVDVYRSIIEKPEQCKNLEFLYHLAELLTDMNHITESIKLFEYLKIRYEESKDYVNQQRSMCDLAWCFYLDRQNENALKILQHQEEICRALPDGDERELGLQKSFGYQAGIYEDLGDFSKALSMYHSQQKICRNMGNYYWLQISLGNEGLLLKNRGQLNEAWNLFKQKENISKEISNMQGLQWAYNYKGDVCFARKNYVSALKYYEMQESIAREIGYYRGLLLSLKRQEFIYQIQKDEINILKVRHEIQKINN